MTEADLLVALDVLEDGRPAALLPWAFAMLDAGCTGHPYVAPSAVWDESKSSSERGKYFKSYCRSATVCGASRSGRASR